MQTGTGAVSPKRQSPEHARSRWIGSKSLCRIAILTATAMQAILWPPWLRGAPIRSWRSGNARFRGPAGCRRRISRSFPGLAGTPDPMIPGRPLRSASWARPVPAQGQSMRRGMPDRDRRDWPLAVSACRAPDRKARNCRGWKARRCRCVGCLPPGTGNGRAQAVYRLSRRGRILVRWPGRGAGAGPPRRSPMATARRPMPKRLPRRSGPAPMELCQPGRRSLHLHRRQGCRPWILSRQCLHLAMDLTAVRRTRGNRGQEAQRGRSHL